MTTILICLVVAGCRFFGSPPADLALMNGVVYTCDTNHPCAEAVAIRDGLIIFCGSAAEAKSFIDKQTEIIDLKGKLVLPGFIDSHTHAISAFKQFYEINLNQCQSAAEIQHILHEYIKGNAERKYIRGRGWSNTMFPRHGPDKKILDAIIVDIPVKFQSEDGHSVWVNSKTLQLAGITSQTADPAGGIIERYPGSAEPSGALRENAAALVSSLFPPYTTEELMQGLTAYQKMANAFGITTAHDAELEAGSNEMLAFRNMEQQQCLTIRFRASMYVDPAGGLQQVDRLIAERSQNKGGLFQTNAAKIFIDGVVEGSTAYLKQPYQHLPESCGEFLWSRDSLFKICAELQKKDFQLHFHSIGDAATAVTLDALSAAGTGQSGFRDMITHLQLVDPADIIRFRELNVSAIPQPYWFMKDDYYYNIQVPYLGLGRADAEYPMAAFFKAGVNVASSSDYPVTVPCNPLIAIQTGITRSRPDTDDPNEVLWPQERVTLEQMLTSFTINGAYANFLEEVTGSITPGKSADLIVLDKNLFQIPVAEISKANVLLTLFKGKKVFEKPDSGIE
jgi:predicted amidohydrolase YtcJ